MSYRSYNNNSLLNVIIVDKRNDFGPSTNKTSRGAKGSGAGPRLVPHSRARGVGRGRNAVRLVCRERDVAVSEWFLQSEHVLRQLSGAYTLLRSVYTAQF